MAENDTLVEQQGLILEVSTRHTGDTVSQDAATSNTSFQVFDTSDFGGTGTYLDAIRQLQVNDNVYRYTNIQDTGFISITPGLLAGVTVGDQVYLYPYAEEKWAMVKLDREDDAVSVRIPHTLTDKLPEGIRDEAAQESVTLVMEQGNWTMKDVYWRPPEILQQYISTDGAAPAAVPTPEAIGGVGVIHVRWTAVLNNDPLSYKLYAAMTPGFTKDATTLIYDGPNTSFTHRPNPPTTGTYYYALQTYDDDGVGPVSTEVSTTLAPIGTYPQDFYVGNLYFDQILGGTINADAFLASTITTRSGGVGAGVDQDPTGIRIYDSLGMLATTLAPDITQLKGGLEATSATFTGPAAFRHDQNEISRGGVLNVRGSTTAPVGAASISNSYPDPVVETLFSGNYGLVWTGTDWATVGDSTPNPLVQRNVGTDVTLAGSPAPRPWGGLAFLGGKWYTLGFKTGPDAWYITRYSSTGVQEAQVTYTPIAGMWGSGGNSGQGLAPAGIGQDGTNILIAEWDQANIRFRIQVRDATTLAVSSTINTGTNSGFTGPVVAVKKSNFDFGSSRWVILSRNGNHFYVFDGTTNAYNGATEAFETPVPGQMSGFDYDGTRFWSTRAKSIASNAWVYKHTTYKWSGLTPLLHHCRLTWRDTDATGGTHETDMGTDVTWMNKKRAAINITAPGIPDSGGTDDPNAFSAYLSTVSNPVRTDYWRQTLPGDGVQAITLKDDVTFSGTNPPATNNFPGATPGKIILNTLELWGDGDIYKGGTKVGVEIDPTSWLQANIDELDVTTYGPARAWYNPITKWIEIELYIQRITSNSASLSIHSPVIVADPYKPRDRVNLVIANNIGGTEAMTRLTMLKDGETNEGRMDIVFATARIWSTGQFAFIKGGWHVV